jgi:hypothetical protein
MATLPALVRDVLLRDASLVDAAMRAGLSHGRHTSAATYWDIFVAFRQQFGLAPYFRQAEDPVPWLQIFAQRVRDGRLAPRGRSVRSSTVADALLFVAQAHTMLGKADPRLLSQGGVMDPRLTRQLRGYAKKDPPPTRVKPIPLPILRLAQTLAMVDNTEESLAASDMMWLGFFFLFRPGEYTMPAEDSLPFHIDDVRLWAQQVPIDPRTATDAELAGADFVALVFTTQKNCVTGEMIGHGPSSDPVICPIRAVVCRILYLRSVDAPGDTFLCANRDHGRLCLLKSLTITRLLRRATVQLGPQHGFTSTDISAKSLRASGAMALLNERVDASMIKLIG